MQALTGPAFVFILIYKVQQNYECNGKPEPAQLFASDSFIFTRGKWLLVAHAETAAPATTALLQPLPSMRLRSVLKLWARAFLH